MLEIKHVPALKNNTLKADGRADVYLRAFLTSALDGGDGKSSRPAELPLIIF
jgi:hypothetical protein